MCKRSDLIAPLLKVFSAFALVVLLTNCVNEATFKFPDEVETIVPGKAMSSHRWDLSPDGTKLVYTHPNSDEVLIYLETNETYNIDRSHCSGGDPYWLDERLLACAGIRPKLFDTEERQLIPRRVVKRDEVDMDTLLSEAGQIYLYGSTGIVLLDHDPYAENAKNYVLGDNMMPNGFKELIAPYPHIALPIIVTGKVYSPDEAYYYTLTDEKPERITFSTLTIYTAADDQEVVSFSTEILKPEDTYRFGEAGWAWDSSGVYFLVSGPILEDYKAIRKLNIPQSQ